MESYQKSLSAVKIRAYLSLIFLSCLFIFLHTPSAVAQQGSIVPRPTFSGADLIRPKNFSGDVQDFSGAYRGEGFYHNLELKDKYARRPIPITMRVIIQQRDGLFAWAWDAVDSKGETVAKNNQKNIAIVGNEFQIGEAGYRYGSIGNDGFVLWVHYNFTLGKRYLMDTSYGLQQTEAGFIFHSDNIDYLINKRTRVEANLIRVQ